MPEPMPNHKPNRTGRLSAKALLAVILWGVSFVLTQAAAVQPERAAVKASVPGRRLELDLAVEG